MIKTLRVLRYILGTLATGALLYLALPMLVPATCNYFHEYLLPENTTIHLKGFQWTVRGIAIEELSIRRPGESYHLSNNFIQNPFSSSRILYIQKLTGHLDTLPESNDSSNSDFVAATLPIGTVRVAEFHGDLASSLMVKGSSTITSTQALIQIDSQIRVWGESHLENTFPDSAINGNTTISKEPDEKIQLSLDIANNPFTLSLHNYSCTIAPGSLHIRSNQKSILEAELALHCTDNQGKEYLSNIHCSTNDEHRTLCIAQEEHKSFVAFEITLPGLSSLAQGIAIHRIDIYDPDSLSDYVGRVSELPLRVDSLSVETDGTFFLLTQEFNIDVLKMIASGQYNNVHVKNLSLEYQTALKGTLSDLLASDLSHMPVHISANSIDVITNSVRCSFTNLRGSTESLIPLSISMTGNNNCSFGKSVLPETSFTCETKTPDTLTCSSGFVDEASLRYSFSVPFENLSPKYVVLTDARAQSEVIQSFLKPYWLKSSVTDGEVSAKGSFNVLKNTLATSIELSKLTLNLYDIDIVNLRSSLSLSYTEDGLFLPQRPFTVDSIDFGVPIDDVHGNFSLSTDNTLHCQIKDLSGKLFQGTVRIPELACDKKASSQTLTASVERIDLSAISQWLDVASIAATGLLSGHIPVTIDTNVLNISMGKLSLLKSGGSVSITLPDSYNSVKIPGFEFSVKTLLSSLQLSEASVEFSYADSKLTSTISLLGSNPKVRNGHPLKLNITLTQNLAALLKTLSISKFLR